MKLAIIGFGGMGQFHLEKSIQRYNDAYTDERIEVVGAYDVSEQRCRVARDFGLVSYSSADEIFSSSEIEAVVIATPNDLHLPYVKRAAEAGKNIIVEKPAGMTLAEVKEMYEVTERAGVVFTPHQNRRWDDDYLTVKNMLESGKIGNIYRIESRVMGANGIPGEWRRERARGGGMMLDWGVHLIDQMLCMVDGKVVSVYCDYSYLAGEEVDDGFKLEVKFDTGFTYRIVVDTNTFIKPPRWRVYGVDGSATVNNWLLEGKVVRCIQREDEKLVGIDTGNGYTRTMANRRSETVEELDVDKVRADKTAFYRNFVDSVRGRAKTTVNRQQIERLFKVMEAARRSAELGEAVKETI